MLAKPPGSLGELENISIALAGVTGQVKNTVTPARVYVLAADNGVAAEGVSSAPQSVTLAQSINLTRGLTGASSLARYFGDGLVVVDMAYCYKSGILDDSGLTIQPGRAVLRCEIAQMLYNLLIQADLLQ